MSPNVSVVTGLIAQLPTGTYFVKAITLAAVMANGPAFGRNPASLSGVQVIEHKSGYNNIPPVAVTDYVKWARASQAVNVLVNDSDANRDILTVIDASAEFGAVAFTSNGLVAYAANDAQAKAYVIHYVLTDGLGSVAQGKVIVSVQ